MASSFKNLVMDQLEGIADLRFKAMFGGYGIYSRETFFGLVTSKNRLYFKTDEKSRPRYEAAGMKPFEPRPGMKMASYYEIPEEILDNGRKLRAWAEEAIAASEAAPQKPKRNKGRLFRPDQRVDES